MLGLFTESGLIEPSPEAAAAMMAAEFPEYAPRLLRLAYQPWQLWRLHWIFCEQCAAERLGGAECPIGAVYSHNLQSVLGILGKRPTLEA